LLEDNKRIFSVFESLLVGSEVSEGEESRQPGYEKFYTFPYINCDGCGEKPIFGVRYKCSVCKNFDYCPNCEDKLDHDHYFLKIKKRRMRSPKVSTRVKLLIVAMIENRAGGWVK
jgi:hypothetical protein